MSFDLATLAPTQTSEPIVYVRERGRGIQGREPIPVIYTLIARNLPANTETELNLTGIDFPFIPLTLFWGNVGNSQNNSDVIMFVRKDGQNIGRIRFNAIALDDGYIFPTMVIHEDNQLFITPDFNLDLLYCWVKPVVAPPPIIIF